ncbi:MAG: acyl-CoA thioesterase [Bacteroidia bacterium]
MNTEEKQTARSTTENFPVKLKLRLDWSELDMFGHINNVMFFKFMQASRVNYWEITRFDRDFLTKKLGPLLVSSSCHFKKPLFYPGNIIIEARVEFIKNSSFGIAHRILNDKNEVCAEGHDVVVLFDFNKSETVTIPQHIRQTIEEIERKKF